MCFSSPKIRNSTERDGKALIIFYMQRTRNQILQLLLIKRTALGTEDATRTNYLLQHVNVVYCTTRGDRAQEVQNLTIMRSIEAVTNRATRRCACSIFSELYKIINFEVKFWVILSNFCSKEKQRAPIYSKLHWYVFPHSRRESSIFLG